MHREGHVGIGMFIYAPFAYVFFSFDWVTLFGYGLIAMAIWSFFPDIDMDLPIPHRGPTHSLPFAVLAGVVTALSFGWAAGQVALNLAGIASYWLTMAIVLTAGFSFGFLGVVGHIIGDVLTPMGIQPWWPGSDKRYSLELVYASDKEANKQLSYMGAITLTGAIVMAELSLI